MQGCRYIDASTFMCTCSNEQNWMIANCCNLYIIKLTMNFLMYVQLPCLIVRLCT